VLPRNLPGIYWTRRATISLVLQGVRAIRSVDYESAALTENKELRLIHCATPVCGPGEILAQVVDPVESQSLGRLRSSFPQLPIMTTRP